MSAILYGVGAGPGDPELLTLKAVRVLQAAPVIAFIASEGEGSLARDIVKDHLGKGKIEIAMRVPMRADPMEAQQAYDRYAAEIACHLKAGRNVAAPCVGDPLFYGSFIHLLSRLGQKHRIEVIPGVSSLGAVAAASAMPVVSRNDTLAVAPATLPEAELEARLRNADAAAIMKVGRHLAKVRRVLDRIGMTKASYVEQAGMKGERILALHEAGGGLDDGAAARYFSMVLARREKTSASSNASIHVPEGAAIVAIGRPGLELALRLKEMLPRSNIHDLQGHDAPSSFRSLFLEKKPIVGVCAAAILMRALGPLLGEKQDEPPVVAVSADGSAAVPLLGGHRGANRLAKAIALALGGQAAITTASDVCLGLALDDPPPGWMVLNPKAAKGIALALLSGQPVALRPEAGNAAWLSESEIPFAAGAGLKIIATCREIENPGDDLILHPKILALGVGCERGVSPEAMIEAAMKALNNAGLSPLSVACVASLDLKSDEPAVHALARHLNVPARFFTAAELEALTPRLINPSDSVFKAVGCHGVAEAAALAASGERSVMAAAKQSASQITLAIARAQDVIDAASVGRQRGRLFVVGIGPGAKEWRTEEAVKAIASADDVVGYGLYLDLIGDLIDGKARHESKMTQEEKRARLALDLAASGRTAALVSSGDAGIYGLAALVFELLERENHPQWNRIEISVVPGLSALQAAASRMGAPINHDFCAISLSDLLTPMDLIERRLRAAAEGDFVIALYNPVSRKRRAQLETARQILLRSRPPETPVIAAKNLGREGESLQVITLGELAPDHADMLTILLVGSSQTRMTGHQAGLRVYTPRGYEKKWKQAK